MSVLQLWKNCHGKLGKRCEGGKKGSFQKKHFDYVGVVMVV